MDAPSSSIFNFDALRRLRAIPVGTAVWFAFLAFAMAAGVHLAGRILATLLPTPQTAALAALDSGTEVLVSGSSRTLRGVEPVRYARKTVNLSSGGLSYAPIEKIVARALERAPNVKLVVLEMDSFPIRADGYALHRNSGVLNQLGLRPADRPATPGRRILRALIESPVVYATRLTPESWLTRDPERLRRMRRGFEPFQGSRNLADDPDYAGHGPERFVQWHREWLREDHSGENVPALVRLCRHLHDRGIRVLLVRLPHLETWMRDVPSEWHAQISSAVQAVQAEVPDGVWYRDLSNASGFDLRTFADGLHYNDAGIARLAEILDPLVESILSDPASADRSLPNR